MANRTGFWALPLYLRRWQNNVCMVSFSMIAHGVVEDQAYILVEIN